MKLVSFSDKGSSKMLLSRGSPMVAPWDVVIMSLLRDIDDGSSAGVLVWRSRCRGGGSSVISSTLTLAGVCADSLSKRRSDLDD